jgi:hypothetical protein
MRLELSGMFFPYTSIFFYFTNQYLKVLYLRLPVCGREGDVDKRELETSRNSSPPAGAFSFCFVIHFSKGPNDFTAIWA